MSTEQTPPIKKKRNRKPKPTLPESLTAQALTLNLSELLQHYKDVKAELDRRQAELEDNLKMLGAV